MLEHNEFFQARYGHWIEENTHSIPSLKVLLVRVAVDPEPEVGGAIIMKSY